VFEPVLGINAGAPSSPPAAALNRRTGIAGRRWTAGAADVSAFRSRPLPPGRGRVDLARAVPAVRCAAAGDDRHQWRRQLHPVVHRYWRFGRFGCQLAVSGAMGYGAAAIAAKLAHRLARSSRST